MKTYFSKRHADALRNKKLTVSFTKISPYIHSQDSQIILGVGWME